MIWDDDYIIPQKRSVGRPVENPFPSPECEADFIRRATVMLERYYKPGDTNSKKAFAFDAKRTMSKTLFWSFIYIYLVQEHQLNSNLQGLLNVIQNHFGAFVASDRTGICKKVGMLNRLDVNYRYLNSLEGAAGREQDKYRAQYRFVVRRWNEV